MEQSDEGVTLGEVGRDALRAVPNAALRLGQSIGDIANRGGEASANLRQAVTPDFTRRIYYNAVGKPIESVGALIGNKTVETFGEGLSRPARQSSKVLNQTHRENVSGAANELDETLLREEALPDFLRMETIGGSFASGVIQFAVPFGAATKGAKGLQMFTKLRKSSSLSAKLANYAGTVVAPGAVVDAVAFRGDEGRLSDLLTDVGLGNNALVEFLASDEDDGFVEGRLKNALEGGILGIPVDFLMGGFRGLRPTREGVENTVPAIAKSDIKRLAEEGEVSVEFAEAHGLNWADDPTLNRDGPSRTSYVESINRASLDEQEAKGAIAVSDAFAAVYAKKTGGTVEDWYQNQAPDVRRLANGDGTPAPDTLFQAELIKALPIDKSPMLAMRTGELDPSTFIKPTGEGGRMVAADIGTAMDKAYKTRWRSPGDMHNPAHQKRAFKALLSEMEFQSQQRKTGEFWYTDDVEDAFHLTSQVIPRIKDDMNLRVVSTVVAGILSNGQKAGKNWENLVASLKAYDETGAFPEVNPSNGQIFGQRGQTIRTQVQLVNYLLEKFEGEEGLAQFLTGLHSPKDLTMLRRESGAYSPSASVAGRADERILGYRIIGPKVGNFAANMMGIGDVTIDRWANRTARRHFGLMTDGRLDKDTGLNDAPTEPERAVAQSLFDQVGRELDKPAKNVQAMLWYYEQRGFNDLGVTTYSESFSDGAKQALRNHGIDPDSVEPRRSPLDSDAGNAGGGETLNQDARGQVEFRDGRKPLITLFEQSDSSTLVHELSHVFRRQLGDIDPALLKQAEDAIGVKDGAWTKGQEEDFATGFEHYLRTGEAPREELKTVFQTFKELLTKVYESVLKDGDIEVPQELRDVFDIMLGKDFNRADISKKKPSNRPPNRPSPSVRGVRQAFAKKNGQLFAPTGQPYAQLDIDSSKRVGTAYGKMKHKPNDPKVKASYDALKTETQSQYESITESGNRLVFTREDPYSSSQALSEDIEANQRMYVFLTEEGSLPDDHPLAAKTGITATTPQGEEIELIFNDLFRGVHDFFGHATEGYQFGHRGEENAWLLHSQMYSDAARPAMATETRGQNSWVNAGEHLRRPDGSLPQRGDADWVHPKDRPFANQKAGLLPKYALEPPVQVRSASASTPGHLEAQVKDTLFQAEKAGHEGVKALDEAVATHVNYARIKTTDDALAAIREIEPVAQSLIDGKIGDVQTMEVVKELAEELGSDPDAVIAGLQASGDSNLAALMVAGRTIRNSLAEDVAKIATQGDARAKSGEDVSEMFEQLLEAQGALTKVDMVVGIAQKNAARAVQSGNIITDGKLPPAAEKAILEAMQNRSAVDASFLKAADSAAAQGNAVLADVLSAAGRSKNPKTAQGVMATLADAAKLGQTNRMSKRIREAKDPTWIEKLVEFRGASILSGPKTFAINWGVGAVSTPYFAMSRLIGAGVTLNRSEMRTASRQLVNLVGSARDIMGMLVLNDSKMPAPPVRTSFKNTIKNEVPQLSGTSATESKRAIKGTKGRIVRIPYTINQLGEEFWSQINYLSTIRTQAMDAADKAVWDNPDIPDKHKPAASLAFVDQYTRDSYDDVGRAARDSEGRLLHEEAMRQAKQVNFMEDLQYGVGQSLLDLKQQHPWVGLIQPFFKAPTNLFRTAVRMTPGANIVQEAHARKKINMTQAQKTQHTGEMVVGAALWTFSGYLAASGQITGTGPSNPTERESLLQAGWQPYSFVREGPDGKKTYTSYQRIDPWATVLGMSADISDLSGYMSSGEQDQIADALVDSAINNFANKLYLRGIADFLETVTNPEKPIDGYANNFIGSFVPNFTKQLAESTDDAYRQPRSMLDAIKRRVPGWAEDLPPRRDILGQPTSPRGGWIPFLDPDSVVSKTASPLAFTEDTDSVVLEEIARLQFGFGMPGETMSDVNIGVMETPEGQNVYDRYVELSGSIEFSGRNLTQAVEALIKSKQYSQLPDPTGSRDLDHYNPKIVAISRLISSYRRAAKRQLLQEVPELAQKIRMNELAGKTGTLPSQSGALSAFDLLEN